MRLLSEVSSNEWIAPDANSPFVNCHGSTLFEILTTLLKRCLDDHGTPLRPKAFDPNANHGRVCRASEGDERVKVGVLGYDEPVILSCVFQDQRIIGSRHPDVTDMNGVVPRCVQQLSG
jgi:hypothetical protein